MKMTTKTLRGESEGKYFELLISAETGRVCLHIKFKGRTAHTSRTISEQVIFLKYGIASDLGEALSAFAVVAKPERNRE